MQQRKAIYLRRNLVILLVAGVLLVGGIGAVALLPRLLTSYQAPTGFDGAATATPPTEDVSEEDLVRIGQRLRDVGLSESGYLFSSGIETHLQRLRDKEVSLEALDNYADDLQTLTQISGQYGQSIPVTFWDVRTDDMMQNNVTEYNAVDAITSPNSPYLALIARAYNRLYDFKSDPVADTALNAAFDGLSFKLTEADRHRTGERLFRIGRFLSICGGDKQTERQNHEHRSLHHYPLSFSTSRTRWMTLPQFGG